MQKIKTLTLRCTYPSIINSFSSTSSLQVEYNQPKSEVLELYSLSWNSSRTMDVRVEI